MATSQGEGKINSVVYSYSCRCKQKHNDDFNERTNKLLYKNIPLTLYSWKGWCGLCVRGELEMETDCYILTQSPSRDYSSTSSSSWLGCSTVGHWEPKPSVWSWFSLRGHPISNCDWNWTGTDSPKPSVAPGYIIVWRPPASCGHTHLHRIQPRPQVKVIFRHPWPNAPASPFFCLFTQVHLLIDGSVEGQYVTIQAWVESWHGRRGQGNTNRIIQNMNSSHKFLVLMIIHIALGALLKNFARSLINNIGIKLKMELYLCLSYSLN